MLCTAAVASRVGMGVGGAGVVVGSVLKMLRLAFDGSVLISMFCSGVAMGSVAGAAVGGEGNGISGVLAVADDAYFSSAGGEVGQLDSPSNRAVVACIK